MRHARLRRARDLLRLSDPEVTTVAERCGIGHLGRFAAAYQAAFGELPSDTLDARTT